MVSLAEDALRFKIERESIDLGLSDSLTEYIDRIALGIQTLHNSERPAIDRRAKEARNRRVA